MRHLGILLVPLRLRFLQFVLVKHRTIFHQVQGALLSLPDEVFRNRNRILIIPEFLTETFPDLQVISGYGGFGVLVLEIVLGHFLQDEIKFGIGAYGVFTRGVFINQKGIGYCFEIYLLRERVVVAVTGKYPPRTETAADRHLKCLVVYSSGVGKVLYIAYQTLSDFSYLDVGTVSDRPYLYRGTIMPSVSADLVNIFREVIHYKAGTSLLTPLVFLLSIPLFTVKEFQTHNAVGAVVLVGIDALLQTLHGGFEKLFVLLRADVQPFRFRLFRFLFACLHTVAP